MRRSLWLIPFCVLAAPTLGFAQAAGVQEAAGDNGVRVGAGRLHPYGQVDTHFVVNPGRLSDENIDSFNAAANAAGTDTYSENDGFLDFRAGLDYVLKSSDMNWNFGALGSRTEYFENSQFNGWNAEILTDFTAYKGGPFEFRLSGGFVRTRQPGNQVALAPIFHNDYSGGAGVSIRPGGGALTLSLDYGILFQDYSESDADNLSALGDPSIFTNLRQNPLLRASWNFLPKTQVFFEAGVQIQQYPDDEESVNFDSYNTEIAAGLTGLLTSRTSVLLKLGYGDPFTEGQSTDFFPIIGQAEYAYLLNAVSKVQVGAFRRVSPVVVFGYVGENSVYARWEQSFGKLQLSLGLDYTFLDFGQQPGVNDNRQDNSVGASVVLNYKVNEWFSVSLSDAVDIRTSNTEDIGLSDFGYVNNDLFLRLSLRY